MDSQAESEPDEPAEETTRAGGRRTSVRRGARRGSTRDDSDDVSGLLGAARAEESERGRRRGSRRGPDDADAVASAREEKYRPSGGERRGSERGQAAGDAGGAGGAGGELGDGCTIWVAGIPDEWSKGPAKLTTFFSTYGKVVSVTVRRKAADAPGGPPRSWALLTFAEVDQADGCVAAGRKAQVKVPVDRGGAEPEMLRLQLKPAKVERELQKTDTGALQAIQKQQASQLLAATKIQAAMRGRLGRSRRRPKAGSVASAAASASRGKRRSSSTTEHAADDGWDSQNQELDDGCTLWVGGIPPEYTKGPAKITHLFTASFGDVVSVTIRKKDSDDEGGPRSWALLTFKKRSSAARCIDAGRKGDLFAPVGEDVVPLQVKRSRVGAELQKPATGALQAIQRQQLATIQAATKIQAIMRGRRSRRERDGTKDEKRSRRTSKSEHGDHGRRSRRSSSIKD
jgi:hypothetical protein